MFTVVVSRTDGNQVSGFSSKDRKAAIENAEEQWRDKSGEVAQVVVVDADGAVVFTRPVHLG